MTSKFIYKVIRIKAGFVQIIIIYNCSKDRRKKIQTHYYLTDRHTICSYQCFILLVNTTALYTWADLFSSRCCFVLCSNTSLSLINGWDWAKSKKTCWAAFFISSLPAIIMLNVQNWSVSWKLGTRLSWCAALKGRVRHCVIPIMYNFPLTADW